MMDPDAFYEGAYTTDLHWLQTDLVVASTASSSGGVYPLTLSRRLMWVRWLLLRILNWLTPLALQIPALVTEQRRFLALCLSLLVDRLRLWVLVLEDILVGRRRCSRFHLLFCI
jgi:hypothetical protein